MTNDKIIVIGDIHGRQWWRDILKYEGAIGDDGIIRQGFTVVFLGDYVSSHDWWVEAEQQLTNLDDILALKEANPDSVILLRGNHDYQHEGYEREDVSGMNTTVKRQFPRERFDRLTQWIYVRDGYLFSHAGVSRFWLAKHQLTIDTINNQAPDDPMFGFDREDPHDFCGVGRTQGPLWIRPVSLVEYMEPGYTYVVGHTPVKACGAMDDKVYTELYHEFVCNPVKAVPDNISSIIVCDAMERYSYLVIDADGPHTRVLPEELRPEVKKPKSLW